MNDYFNHKGINFSSLKEWGLISPLKWKKKFIDKINDAEEPKIHFTFGSLVDTLLFTPELLDSKFFIGDEPKLPSENIISIVTAVYNKLYNYNKEIKDLYKELPDKIKGKEYKLESDELLEVLSVTDWNTRWSLEKRVASIIKDGEDYFNNLVKAENRQIISAKMNLEAIELVNILKTTPYTKDFFIARENVEVIFQKEIYVDYKGVSLKGAIDILIIDHNKKTIEINDFKTAYNAFEFKVNAKKYDYVGQLTYYVFLFYLYKQITGEYKDYTIKDSKNIVIDIVEKIPYIYTYSYSTKLFSKEGTEKYINSTFGIDSIIKSNKKGWKQKLDEILWHIENNKWDLPKEFYEKNYIELNF